MLITLDFPLCKVSLLSLYQVQVSLERPFGLKITELLFSQREEKVNAPKAKN